MSLAKEHNFELYSLFKEVDTVKRIKINRLRWTGDFMSCENDDVKLNKSNKKREEEGLHQGKFEGTGSG